jgi:hypothetical protein
MPITPKHWNYFLGVESELVACTRFVEFTENNFSCYSNEFAKIIVLASAEVDSILRELCKEVNSASNAHNIAKYYPVLISRFPHFQKCKVDIPRYKLRIDPWENWTLDTRPDWWSKGYNKLKHERSENFSNASLKNALSAVGAQFLAVLHYHQHMHNESVSVDFSLRTALYSTCRPEADRSGMYWNYGEPWHHVKADRGA